MNFFRFFRLLIILSLIPYYASANDDKFEIPADFSGKITYAGDYEIKVYNYNGGQFYSRNDSQIEAVGDGVAKYTVYYQGSTFKAILIQSVSKSGWGQKYIPSTFEGNRNGVTCSIKRIKFYCSKEEFEPNLRAFIINDRLVFMKFTGNTIIENK